MNIYVGNLAQNVKEEDLNTLFSQHGKVDSVKIIRDMYTKRSKGFGFIEMLVKDEAQKALDVLNKFDLKGKRLIVNDIIVLPVKIIYLIALISPLRICYLKNQLGIIKAPICLSIITPVCQLLKVFEMALSLKDQSIGINIKYGCRFLLG